MRSEYTGMNLGAERSIPDPHRINAEAPERGLLCLGGSGGHESGQGMNRQCM